ncbi:MAG: glucosidase, partial [Burkholderiaceae bacterium]|nr:glucosidase [Burkholderiaceae bacterium]
ECHVLPTIWFRNTWTWGCMHEGCSMKPHIAQKAPNLLSLNQETLGLFHFEVGPDPSGQVPAVLFTDNESNLSRLYGTKNVSTFVKDAFHDFVVLGKTHAVNPKACGTKAAPHYRLRLASGESQTIRLRLYSEADGPHKNAVRPFDQVFADRIQEADDFYDSVSTAALAPHKREVVRQGYAGLIWTKQFYHYVVSDWLEGDPNTPPPPPQRQRGRNCEWTHLHSRDVFSMPDKWEYPWFAAWDLAFHTLLFARVDPAFAKSQLTLLLREWYLHPNGQLPAYEFVFGDVNPPVHAWAAWRVYKISATGGRRDRDFLESVFQKLLLNFTWWVNRKDVDGKNIFAGGFLGLDNIGVFDRSKPLPGGGSLQQADGTAWMAFYCLTMLGMALELAWDGERVRPAYEDMASKFFEHFVQITDAMNSLGGTGLWDEEDGVYYDQLEFDHTVVPLKTRSLVSLLPLIAVEVLEEETINRLPGFSKRLDWFLMHRRDLARHIAYCDQDVPDVHRHRLLAIPSRERLVRLLRYMFDEQEFLSPFGIRSLSKFHAANPYVFAAEGQEHRVQYTPGESNAALFGGNSNWRGPIWFPLNYLLIEALERYHYFYGESLKVECPTGSGNWLNLRDAAREIATRLTKLFLPQADGRRPCHGEEARFQTDPHWRDLVLFHEYFHAETGKGLGASHQTGWTALVIRYLEESGLRP